MSVVSGALDGLRRNLHLTARSAAYELRKQLAYRTGFIVRELLRGLARPAVMILVYAAIFERDGLQEIEGWRFDDLVGYMILTAIIGKLVFHERLLDLSEQIFEGRITKYMVMPMRFFFLPFGRFVQHSAVQVAFAGSLWIAGALVLPRWWPVPASATALFEVLTLVGLGSYCYFLLYYILNSLAFWLDVIWSLLVMSRFVTLFVSGALIPISIMPEGFGRVFFWLFPYWTICAPIEICMGRDGPQFLHGVGVLLGSIVALECLRARIWRRGARQYTGSGM